MNKIGQRALIILLASSPLCYAQEEQRFAITSLLAAATAASSIAHALHLFEKDKDSMTADHVKELFMTAVTANNLELVKHLVDQQKSHDISDEVFVEAMKVASTNNWPEMVKHLLDHKRTENMDSSFILDVIKNAINGNHAELVQTLLNHKIGLSVQAEQALDLVSTAVNAGYNAIAAIIHLNWKAHHLYDAETQKTAATA